MAPKKNYGDPASLQDIVINTTFRHKLRTTELARLLAEDIKSTVDFLNRALSEEYNQYDTSKLGDTLQLLMTELTTLQNIARLVSLRYTATFFGLLHEIRDWIIFISKNDFFSDPHVKYLEFFITRVAITQSGQIDRPKTILTALEESMFEPEIYPEYISTCCVEEKDLRRVANNVRKKLKEKNVVLPQLVSIKTVTKKSIEMAIASTLAYYVPVSSFWDQLGRQDLLQRAALGLCSFGDVRDQCANYDQLVIVEGHQDMVRWHLSRLPTRRLVDPARFLLAHNLTPQQADRLQYVAARLGGDTWCRLLRGKLPTVLPAVLGSWRWRGLALTWWRATCDKCHIGDFRVVLLCAPLDADCYDEVTLLLHAMFDTAPPHLRDHDVLLSHDLPALFALRRDPGFLAPFLRYFEGERRARLLARVTDSLAADERARLYTSLREAVPGLSLPMKMSLAMSVDSVKKLLLAHHPPTEPDDENYNELCMTWCVADVDELKREILGDLEFITEYLFGHWYSASGQALLLWCLSGNGAAVEELLDGGLLETVYPRIVLECGSFEIAEAGLALLRVSADVSATVKAAAANSNAVRALLVSLAVSGDTPAAEWSTNWGPCLSDPSNPTDLLTSPSGLSGIIAAILRFDEYETDPALCEPASDLLMTYHDFINTVLRPHSLCEQIDEQLKEYGHPNTRDLPGYPPGEVDELSARVIVDYHYRSFRSLLHLTQLQGLSQLEKLPPTMLSQQLESRANLSIPVVV